MTQKSDEFKAASARAKARQMTTPHAIQAIYDPQSKRVWVQFNTGIGLFFNPHDMQGLTTANDDELKLIHISPSGFGLHFPKMDADIYLPSLLEGLTGSRRWMAAQLGRQGGKSTSKLKAKASRSNGQLGGRPKKKPHPATMPT